MLFEIFLFKVDFCLCYPLLTALRVIWVRQLKIFDGPMRQCYPSWEVDFGYEKTVLDQERVWKDFVLILVGGVQSYFD